VLISADQETVTEIGGVKMDTYVDWGALRHVISLLGLPSLSVPCGFTAAGLPVGLQITAVTMRTSRCCNSVTRSSRRRSAGAAARRCRHVWRLFKFPSHHSDKRCMTTIVIDSRVAPLRGGPRKAQTRKEASWLSH